MKFETIKITEITPAEYNPRKIDDDEKQKLKNSLNEFGLVDPIVINLKNMNIIGGHQRYEAILDEYMLKCDFNGDLNIIKLGDIGWVFRETDLKIKDEAHEKALNLALNRISGEWDTGKLGLILDEFEEIGFNLELTGFNEFDDEVQLNKLMGKIEFDEPLNKTQKTNTNDSQEDKDYPNNTTGDEGVSDETEDNNSIGFYQITILFDSEDEMINEYDKLIELGYTCRMSNS